MAALCGTFVYGIYGPLHITVTRRLKTILVPAVEKGHCIITWEKILAFDS